MSNAQCKQLFLGHDGVAFFCHARKAGCKNAKVIAPFFFLHICRRYASKLWKPSFMLFCQ